MPMTIDKAQITLPSDREVKVTRTFKAPRALVFRAYTEPALVRRWMLGPPGWSMPVCDMDVRVGGSYRWKWKNDSDGAEFGFFGTFREVQPPSKIVHTERYDPGTLPEAYRNEGEAIITTTSRSVAISTGMSATLPVIVQRGTGPHKLSGPRSRTRRTVSVSSTRDTSVRRGR